MYWVADFKAVGTIHQKKHLLISVTTGHSSGVVTWMITSHKREVDYAEARAYLHGSHYQEESPAGLDIGLRYRISKSKIFKSETTNIFVNHYAPKSQLSRDNHSKNECLCYSSETKTWHNFCYHPPYDHSIRGKRFNCRFISYLHRLNLLNFNNETFLGPEKFKSPNCK
uniref:Uncharacterized protein n=1 Tax=Romanomermis culicivorax TaxID=13658 RepID=A0A915IYL4_ROMCU